MSYNTDYDSLILFSFETAQDIAAGLRETNWAKESYQSWEEKGMGMISFMVLQDIPQSQLQARMSAITATKKHLLAQAQVYHTVYHQIKETPQGKECWDELISLVNLDSFKQKCFEREKKIMTYINHPEQVMEQATQQTSKKKAKLK